MVLRILASIILLFSILFMPFWLSVILALLGMIYFGYFFEAVILMLLSDILYGIKEARFYDIIFISALTTLILILVIEFIKKKLKFYN